MQFITRPLLHWPRPPATKRTAGGYKQNYGRTLDMLDRELRHLEATGDVIIQMDIEERHISRGGTPYGDARPKTPRVALAITSKKHGPMTYYCDAHHSWQDNMRAIALGLERLRLVERTGIIGRGEQYTGFKQLPGSVDDAAAPAMSVDEAAAIVAQAAVDLSFIQDPTIQRAAVDAGAKSIRTDVGVFQTLFREAAKRKHPDAGGERPEWDRLNTAAEILRRHFNIA